MLRQKSDHKIRLFSSSPRVFKEDVDGTEMDKRTNHSSSSSTNNDVSARVIPRPAGASRVETKVIRTALGYDKEKWNVLLSCVRDNLAAAQLDWSTTWKAQKPEKLAEVFNAVEEHFPDTRRFADHWAVNRIAHQYWSQRKHQLRIMRNPTSSSKAKDDVPARNIPCLIPTYKVPMNHIRTTIGYDKKEWNRLRNCVRENVTVARLKWSLPWRFQKPEKLRQVYDAVEDRFPEMRRFAEQWAAKAMTKVFWDCCKRRGRHHFSLFTDESIDSPKSTGPIKKNKATGRKRGTPPKNKQRRIVYSI